MTQLQLPVFPEGMTLTQILELTERQKKLLTY